MIIILPLVQFSIWFFKSFGVKNALVIGNDDSSVVGTISYVNDDFYGQTPDGLFSLTDQDTKSTYNVTDQLLLTALGGDIYELSLDTTDLEYGETMVYNGSGWEPILKDYWSVIWADTTAGLRYNMPVGFFGDSFTGVVTLSNDDYNSVVLQMMMKLRGLV